LWIAKSDVGKLPKNVTELRDHGLTIAECDDVGPYKKIVPALEQYPHDVIVTADDDYYYPPRWLGALVAAHAEYPNEVICHTARRMLFDGPATMQPYRSWPQLSTGAGRAVLPTGYGGVLYPPGSLPAETLDRPAYMALAPTADDLWLRWMSALNGVGVRVVSEHRPSIEWQGSQRQALVRTNLHGGGNDRQIGKLVERYGLEMFRD